MTTVALSAAAPADRPWRGVFHMVWRFLTLRTTAEDFDRMTWRHLLLGLVSVWIVGMGRWWDSPDAHILQHLGLGSVAYVFILAAIIWIIFHFLDAQSWHYRKILTAITLTSFPGILYAIPIERFVTAGTASDINLTCLAIVATWRLAMMAIFLRRSGGLSRSRVIAGLGAPLMALLTILAATHALNATIMVMGGVRDPIDRAITMAIGPLSILTALFLIGYFILASKTQSPR